jgi:hypothetical protein
MIREKLLDVESSDSSFPELAVADPPLIYMCSAVGDIHRHTDKWR